MGVMVGEIQGRNEAWISIITLISPLAMGFVLEESRLRFNPFPGLLEQEQTEEAYADT